MTPGLDATGVRAATFCAADGIADPNGVTMGFARAAQVRGGVTVLRDTEVTGIDVSGGRIAGVRDVARRRSPPAPWSTPPGRGPDRWRRWRA